MQILRYMALQWKEMYDQGQTVGGKLPPIIPIVIYQGRGAWQARASFQDLVEMPSEAFKEFVPDFTFAFFNIGKLDEEKVQENVVLKFYVAIIKALGTPQLRELLPQLSQGLYKSLGQRTALEYIEIFFKYLVKSTGHLGQEDYKQALGFLPEGGGKIMETLADQWQEQGAQKEREKAEEWIKQEKNKWIDEGRISTLQNVILENLTERFDVIGPSLTDKLKSIQSLETLNALFRKTNRVDSLEEFRELVDRVLES